MRHLAASRTATLLLAWAFVSASVPAPARAHEPPTAGELERARQAGDLQARLEFVKQLENERLSPALQEQALLKLRRASLEASGLTPQQVNQQLFGGLAMAFPFTARTELPLSGTARTLTILIDFADMRADDLLPGMTPDRFAANIYGSGTPEAQASVPFESVNAYYRRASEGKVNIQGNVLGWFHLPQARSAYAPRAATPEARNRAIFNMMTAALSSFDATHDFAQYDHDHDGDIDQVTVIYAGPNTGWGSFFWAYKWNFFIPEASTRTFDSKRLNQFVFQFASRRGPMGQDFNPQTLIHEMGHSFGLADYYDYDPAVGNGGGLGGLDMMDANVGNHNAFSRWLLDWIRPEVIGSARPAPKVLVASASNQPGPKAIAVFPSISNTSAPDREMFIVENRVQTGNDATLPGDGLLIWHVDARPNALNSDFLMDNSYSPHKLIRLVRADSASDFGDGELGGASTFFRPPLVFTPTSTPSSDGLNGPTGVSISGLSPPAESMTLTVGNVPAVGGPAPARAEAVADAGAPTTPAALGQAIGRITRTPEAPAPAGAVAGQPAPAATSTPAVADQLAQLAAMLDTATPAAIQTAWNDQAPTLVPVAAAPAEGPASAPPAAGAPPAALVSQLMLTSLAAKDGPAAVKAALALPEGELRNRTFTSVLEAWANNNPYEASRWYFRPEQASLRSSKDLVAGPRFAYRITRWAAANGIEPAIASVKELEHPTEVWGAVDALSTAANLISLTEDELFRKLDGLGKHQETMRIFRQTRAVRRLLEKSQLDASSKGDIRQLMNKELSEF